MPDDSGAPHFFDLTGRVGDDPMAIQELYGVGPFVDDRDRVQEEPLALTRVGVIGRVARVDAHAHAASQGFRGGHPGNIAADPLGLLRQSQLQLDLSGKTAAKRASEAASNVLRQPSRALPSWSVPWFEM